MFNWETGAAFLAALVLVVLLWRFLTRNRRRWARYASAATEASMLGLHEEAEKRFLQCVTMAEQLWPDSLSLAMSYTQLGDFYGDHARPEEAERLFEKSLAIEEKVFGPEHPCLGITYNDLGMAARARGDYKKALERLNRSLEIKEAALGRDDPDFALTLNNLAGTYMAMGMHTEAEKFYAEAAAIRKQALGPNHAEVARDLNDLGYARLLQEKYEEAEKDLREAVDIYRLSLGDTPPMGAALTNLAELQRRKGDYDEAERLYKKVLTIDRTFLGRDHPELARDLSNLAQVYTSSEEHGKAVQCLDRAASILGARAAQLRQHGQDAEAEGLESYRREIQGELSKARSQAAETSRADGETADFLDKLLAGNEDSFGGEQDSLPW